jgi:hypothetical protein
MEKTQINKIRAHKGISQQIPMKFDGLLRNTWNFLYSNKLQNLKDIGKFLDAYDLP